MTPTDVRLLNEKNDARRAAELKPFSVQEFQEMQRAEETQMVSKNEFSKGRCCCCCLNARGSKWIVMFDILALTIILNPLRFFAALMVKCSGYNQKVFKCYNTVRIVTFVLQTIVLLLGLILVIVMHVTDSDLLKDLDLMLPLSSVILILCTAFILVVVMDYHFTRVVHFASKQTDFRLKKMPFIPDSDYENEIFKKEPSEANVTVQPLQTASADMTRPVTDPTDVTRPVTDPDVNA